MGWIWVEGRPKRQGQSGHPLQLRTLSIRFQHGRNPEIDASSCFAHVTESEHLYDFQQSGNSCLRMELTVMPEASKPLSARLPTHLGFDTPAHNTATRRKLILLQSVAKERGVLSMNIQWQQDRAIEPEKDLYRLSSLEARAADCVAGPRRFQSHLLAEVASRPCRPPRFSSSLTHHSSCVVIKMRPVCLMMAALSRLDTLFT